MLPAAKLKFFRLLPATLALTLLAACGTPAPDSPPAPAAAALPQESAIPFGKGISWKLTREGFDDSFVLGTMHVPDPKVVRLSHALEAAFKSTSQAAFEVLIDDRNPFWHPAELISRGLMPKGQSLSDMLDPESYDRLLRLAGQQRPHRLRIGPHHISRFEPWIVMELLGRYDLTASHLDPYGTILDDWLERRARIQDKRVVGLETFEEQFTIVSGMAIEDQAAILDSYLDNQDLWLDYRTMAEIYLSGETARFYEHWRLTIADLDPGVAQRYAERFLDGRNRRMVERALPLLEAGSTFIAVGALHLPGEQGILRLFEAEGFTVTRLD